MSDNSDSDFSAKFQAFDFIRSEVEYATEWYSESPGRPSLSRYRDQVEADMSEMSELV